MVVNVLELISEYDIPNEMIISDVERVFKLLDVSDNEANRKLMLDIDRAKYVNPYEFIDRFGRTLPISKLSTGCNLNPQSLGSPNSAVQVQSRMYAAPCD